MSFIEALKQSRKKQNSFVISPSGRVVVPPRIFKVEKINPASETSIPINNILEENSSLWHRRQTDTSKFSSNSSNGVKETSLCLPSPRVLSHRNTLMKNVSPCTIKLKAYVPGDVGSVSGLFESSSDDERDQLISTLKERNQKRRYSGSGGNGELDEEGCKRRREQETPRAELPRTPYVVVYKDGRSKAPSPPPTLPLHTAQSTASPTRSASDIPKGVAKEKKSISQSSIPDSLLVSENATKPASNVFYGKINAISASYSSSRRKAQIQHSDGEAEDTNIDVPSPLRSAKVIEVKGSTTNKKADEKECKPGMWSTNFASSCSNTPTEPSKNVSTPEGRDAECLTLPKSVVRTETLCHSDTINISNFSVAMSSHMPVKVSHSQTCVNSSFDSSNSISKKEIVNNVGYPSTCSSSLNFSKALSSSIVSTSVGSDLCPSVPCTCVGTTVNSSTISMSLSCKSNVPPSLKKKHSSLLKMDSRHYATSGIVQNVASVHDLLQDREREVTTFHERLLGKLPVLESPSTTKSLITASQSSKPVSLQSSPTVLLK